MMNTMRGFFNPNHLDQSSRANDVIVVRHRDGSLHSTPFNVRFGKVQIWNSNDKVVQVEVNGELTAAFMKIGEGGEAYWLQPTYGHTIEGADALGGLGTTALHQSQGSSAGITGSPAEDATSLVGSEFSLNDDYPVRPESPVDLWEAQAHPITAEGAAHATVLDEEQQRETSQDALVDAMDVADSGDALTNPDRAHAGGAGAKDSGLDVRNNNNINEDNSTPLLQGDDHGRYKVVRGAIHSAGDAQAAHLALQAMAAAEKAERRLSSMMPADPYLMEQALNEFPEAATARPVPDAASASHDNTPNRHKLASGAGAGTASATGTETSPLEAEKAAAENSSPEEPLDLNASKRDLDDDTIEGGGDEYYLEPIDIEEYVDLYGEDELLVNTSFTSSTDNDAATAAAGNRKQKPAGSRSSSSSGGAHPTKAVAEKRGGITGKNTSASTSAGGTAQSANASPAKGGRDDKTAQNRKQHDNNPYFTRTLIPVQADIIKLNLQDGCNKVRYLTRKTPNSEDVVAVTCNIFLWDYRDRIVVSDVDGTITKSDLWGHFYSMLGKGGEWTHPGICSLYSKIDSNGYRMVYLTARSVTQINQTKQYLWTLDQDGVRLPLGPVLTVPQKFFTALTQEVAKRSHIFKIACLTSVKEAFPERMKPFFAGFGNRYNDVLSYVAVGVPQHKIFIIDPSSVLHVARVKQTYPNLAKLVDVTFPPVKHHHAHHQHHLSQQQASRHHNQQAGSTAGSGAASVMSGSSVCGSSDDEDDLPIGSPASLEEYEEILASQAAARPSQSAAFTMVDNDLQKAKLNPNDHDTFHSVTPSHGNTAWQGAPEQFTDAREPRPTVPGAALPLSEAQAAAAATLTITSGTVLAGKVAPSSSPSSGLARGIVVQPGKVIAGRPAPLAAVPAAAGGAGRSVSELFTPQTDDYQEDAEFSAYNFWRVDPKDIVSPSNANKSASGAKGGKTGKATTATTTTTTSAGAASGPTARSAAADASSRPSASAGPSTQKPTKRNTSSPSSIYSPTTARQVDRVPFSSPGETGAATTASVLVDQTDATTAKRGNGGGGGGFFSFGFGRGGPTALEKKKAAEEAAALEAAKRRMNMHPDSLNYYFASSATQPSGSGTTAARDLAERARQHRDQPQTASPTNVGKPGADQKPTSTRSTSPTWAFWRRGNTGANPTSSPTVDPTASSKTSGGDGSTAVLVPEAPQTDATSPHASNPKPDKAAVKDSSPAQAKDAVVGSPAAATSTTAKFGTVNIDELFEL